MGIFGTAAVICSGANNEDMRRPELVAGKPYKKIVCLLIMKTSQMYIAPATSSFYRPILNQPHSYAPDAQTTSICHASPHSPHSVHPEDYKSTLRFLSFSDTPHIYLTIMIYLYDTVQTPLFAMKLRKDEILTIENTLFPFY